MRKIVQTVYYVLFIIWKIYVLEPDLVIFDLNHIPSTIYLFNILSISLFIDFVIYASCIPLPLFVHWSLLYRVCYFANIFLCLFGFITPFIHEGNLTHNIIILQRFIYI